MRPLLIAGLAALLAPLAQAQLTIKTSTVDGGGGTSTGGSFSLSGTVGQHDAAPPSTGGTFALTGGFWGGATTGARPFDVWAENNIPEGFDRSFGGDADRDGIPNGEEYFTGSNPMAAESGAIAAARRPKIQLDPFNPGSIILLISQENVEGVTLVIKRSTSLNNFTEVYRFNFDTLEGNSDPDFGVGSGSPLFFGDVTVFQVLYYDGNPPAGRAFYIVEFELNQ